jgi:phosphohistidine phosphatase
LKVFLVRHADADADIPEGLSDEARALTTKARQTIAGHFSALAERIGMPRLVLTSPLVRAVQTASILSFSLGYEGPLRAHRSLLPDMPVGAIDGVLNEANAADALVLVGHNPSMTAMAAHLLGMQNFPKPVMPGTVIALERNGGTRLLFYAPPGQQVLESV